MICFDPFRRAAWLALAWCLIGLGIDLGEAPEAVSAPPESTVCNLTDHQPAGSTEY